LRAAPLPEPKEAGGDVDGPLVLPGTYVATVYVNGKAIGARMSSCALNE
jgi:hypothetical protein